MVKLALGGCAVVLLAACTLPEISTDVTGLAMKKGSRPTGSNIARLKRDPDLEGWRQGFDRDDMRKIQVAPPLSGEGGSEPKGLKGNWYR